jgi:phosphoribosylformylglycinamidine synthase
MTRALVLRTAGTNCDRETVLALEAAGAEVELLHLHRLIEEPARLDAVSIFVLAGGFSYGDDVAAGRIFAHEVRHHLGAELKAFVDRGGLALGICNGFQVLLETGLLDPIEGGEGVEGGEGAGGGRDTALSANESGLFECRWVTLRSEECACPWLEDGELIPMPAAHAEGRFVVRDDATLKRLRSRGQIALRYATPTGELARDYPDCPNGSVESIAGICDPTGRVLGLMPHPERNITPWHHPQWTRMSGPSGGRTEGEGLPFYRRMVEVAAGGAP